MLSNKNLRRSLGAAAALSAVLLLAGCGDKTVSTVKALHSPFGGDETIGDFADKYKYCGKSEWSSEEKNGKRTATFVCTLKNALEAPKTAQIYYENRVAALEKSVTDDSPRMKSFIEQQKKMREAAVAKTSRSAENKLQLQKGTCGEISMLECRRNSDRAQQAVRSIEHRIEFNQGMIERNSTKDTRIAATQVRVSQKRLAQAQAQLPDAKAKAEKLQAVVDQAEPNFKKMVADQVAAEMAQFDQKAAKELADFKAKLQKSVEEAKADAMAPRPWADVKDAKLRMTFALANDDKSVKPEAAGVKVTFADGRNAVIPLLPFGLPFIAADKPILGDPAMPESINGAVRDLKRLYKSAK